MPDTRLPSSDFMDVDDLVNQYLLAAGEHFQAQQSLGCKPIGLELGKSSCGRDATARD